MIAIKPTSKILTLCTLSMALAACGDANSPEPMQSLSFAESFQAQLIQAQPGDLIEVPPGTHEFTRSLSLTVPGVTIKGAGMYSSILSFKNQAQGAEGLLVSADNFVIQDLAIEDTVGDALKINESTNVTIRRVRTEWTRGANTENGAYGIYPVQTRNVLIEGSVAIGASDAGIYVGQSSQIIVRNSRAEFNVAGIEIENSTYADVYDNVATNNTGGILVFDLPNLSVQGGQATRVFNNEIYENNTENFAPEGNIVGNVPPGTGLLILANDNIEVFENDFRDNKSVNIMVYSFVLGGRIIKDPEYDPYPEQIYIHDNNYYGGGTVPGHAALKAWHAISGLLSPNIVWGGLVKPGGDGENIICLGEASNESFMDLKGGLDPNDISYDITPHKCSLPRLQTISFDFPGDD
jgi:parallel beta-helix repeat protein